MATIIRGSSDDRMAYDWARREQGYGGTWAEWLEIPLYERQEYEEGAAGGSGGKTVLDTDVSVALWRGGGPGNGEYVVSPQGWHSADGDTWTDDAGEPCGGEAFDATTIKLSGGPRDGEEVA